MGLFDRRKDAKTSAPDAPEEPLAAGVDAAPSAPEPGQPDPPPAEASPTREIHTVAAGESLADLSARYGVPAEAIARQNHLSPAGQIHAGQVFVITRG